MEKIDLFFQAARSVKLSRKEKASVWRVFQGLWNEKPVRKWFSFRHRMGMEDLKPFIENARRVSLTRQERDQSWGWILERQPEGFIPGPPEPLVVKILNFLPRLHLVPAIAIALIFVVGIGATVSVAAESALPGEFLYPVKVDMNEPIVAAFTFSEEGRARLETKRTTRRMEEAEALALKASLKPEMAQALQKRLKKHSVKLQRSIALLRERGQTDVADALDMELAATIGAHESVLVRLAESRTQLKTEIAAVLKGVQTDSDDSEESTDTSITIAMDSQSSGDIGLAPMISSKIADGSSVRIDQRLERTRDKIVESKQFIERSKSDTATDAIEKSEARIAQAESLLNEAQTEMLRGNTDDALALRKASMVQAEEAKLLLKVENALTKNVPGPVEKSTGPRTTVQQVNARLAAEVQVRLATEAVEKLKKGLSESTDVSNDAVREARRKLLIAEELLKKAKTSLALDQWDDVGTLTKRTQTVAEKALALLLSEPLNFKPKAQMKSMLGK